MMIRRLSMLLLLALLGGVIHQPPPARAAPLPATAPCMQAAMAALTRQGFPYVWGARGPSSFDCSGLVWWAYAQAGVSIGTSTYTQANNGVAIPCRLSDLNGANTLCWAPGDLILLQYSTGQHVAIYTGGGLFMDCYNQATGCILHNPASDPFYQANFWQARRIVGGCEGEPPPPTGIPDPPPVGEPSGDRAAYVPQSLDELPDLLAYTTFVIPQCNACEGAPDAGLKHQEPPANDGWIDTLLYPFKWLAVAIQNLFVDLMCFLLSLFQRLANLLADMLNLVIRGINQLWRLAIFAWLTIRAWIYAAWAIVELLRDFWQAALLFIATVGAWLTMLYDLLVLALTLAGQSILLLFQITGAAFGIVGWIGGIALNIIGRIIIALQGTAIPPELSRTSVIYYIVRGGIEGIQSSQLLWLFVALYVMAYVAFVSWLSRFLSRSGGGA